MKNRLQVPFTKMSGAGNDYIYIVAPDGRIPILKDGQEVADVTVDPNRLAIEISDRHFGVGSDGLVLIIPGGEGADFQMRMFNNDGSEAQMCGNASRCIGRFVREAGLTDKPVVTLSTKAGIKTIYINVSTDGEVESVEVDMGAPELDAEKVPARNFTNHGPYSTVTLSSDNSNPTTDNSDPITDNSNLLAVCVSMGNPHGVIFLPEGVEVDDELVLKSGPKFETADCWPEKANIEFIRKEGDGKFRGRVWERGSGETFACGTGACAVFAAAVATGLHDPSKAAEIALPGGALTVRRTPEGHLLLSGPTTLICSGLYNLPNLS